MCLRAVCVTVALVMASCGGGESPTSPPATDRSIDSTGIELFNERVVGSNPGCVTCHTIDGEIVLVGPSLAGLANRAGSQVPGMTAADYVRQSILEPDAHIVDGFDSGQMPGGWAELLTKEQVDSLVELLLEP